MRFEAKGLVELTKTMCLRAGSEEAEAALVARHLVDANLMGHDSHGIGMLPIYVEELLDGRLAPGRHVTVVRDKGPFLVLDGNRGYGQVIGGEAMALGIAKAREHGLAVVALRNTHHLGRIGAWGEMCLEHGLISIHYVNVIGHRALVAPFGGSDSRFTTNPYCTAIPATDKTPPLVLDMATSRVAHGKVRVAHNAGLEVADGTLIDADGNPTRDPGVMFREPSGSMLAMGEHKGYGLALVCEILAGALTGGGTCLPEREHIATIINNMLSVIIDPAALTEVAEFQREVDAITAHVKASPPASGVEEVMVPGDPERKARAEREARGVPLSDGSWAEIVGAAEKLGIERAEVEAIAGVRGQGRATA